MNYSNMKVMIPDIFDKITKYFEQSMFLQVRCLLFLWSPLYYDDDSRNVRAGGDEAG